MSQQHQGPARPTGSVCFATAYKWPGLNQIHQPLKLTSCPRSQCPCPQHLSLWGGDASGPRLVPAGSDELPPVARPGGQQSSARCSRLGCRLSRLRRLLWAGVVTSTEPL